MAVSQETERSPLFKAVDTFAKALTVEPYDPLALFSSFVRLSNTIKLDLRGHATLSLLAELGIETAEKHGDSGSIHTFTAHRDMHSRMLEVLTKFPQNNPARVLASDIPLLNNPR